MATDSLSGAPLSWPEQPGELPRQFESRQALAAELQRLFPEAEGSLSPIRGGRHQAEQLLGRADRILKIAEKRLSLDQLEQQLAV